MSSPLAQTFIISLLTFSAVAAAEDTDFDAMDQSLFQANVGLVSATQRNENPSESQRFLLRMAIPGFPFSDLGDGLHLFRANGSAEWNVQENNLEAYNLDLDTIAFLGHGGDGAGVSDFRISAGYVQVFHDDLMGENYDISAKLIDAEARFTSDRTIPFLPKAFTANRLEGIGFSLLGYQQREYQDGTTLKAVDIGGLRFDIGALWGDGPFPLEWSVAAEGDIGWGNGMVYDTLLDSRLTLHLPAQPLKYRLQLFATHHLHHNSSRSDPTDGLLRLGIQFLAQSK